MPTVDEKNITDIDHLREKLDNEKLEKIIQEKQLDGFLNSMKSNRSLSGINFAYDVDEVKKMIGSAQYE